MSQTSTVSEPADVAAALEATDVLVLRPIGGDSYLLVGGIGLGAEWAGAVEVHLTDEPVLQQAAATGAPVRRRSPRPVQVVGPYQATGAVVVPVLPGLFVVFGKLRDDFDDLPDARWVAAAQELAGAFVDVPAESYTAEGERAEAALATLAAWAGGDLRSVLHHVAATAALSLGCEVGITYHRPTGRVAVSDRGWPWPAHLGLDDIEHAFNSIWEHGVDGYECHQDLSSGALPVALGPTSRLASALVVQVSDCTLLALGHNDSRPRGFTTSDIEIVLELAEAAAPLIGLAVLGSGDATAGLADERLERAARIDHETGLVNEVGWAEVLTHAEASLDRSPGVVLVVRSARGGVIDPHALAALGRLVNSTVRQQDPVARVGPDELAVLLREAGPALGEKVARRLQQALSGHGAVVGWAARHPGGTLADAHDVARRRAEHRRMAALSATRR
jgi:GGDEF domain-containing protein